MKTQREQREFGEYLEELLGSGINDRYYFDVMQILKPAIVRGLSYSDIVSECAKIAKEIDGLKTSKEKASEK